MGRYASTNGQLTTIPAISVFRRPYFAGSHVTFDCILYWMRKDVLRPIQDKILCRGIDIYYSTVFILLQAT
jgi:hypothetical protein